MSDRKPFDLFRSPLQSGRTLIEASAGTGKTYTIAGIVLRLILEQDLGIEQILVTTYTELATSELRDRIRRLLREALLDFERGSSPNEFRRALLEGRRDDPAAIGRLRLALQTFDDAPIHTIHGFCQRMLKDRAFESGALFDAELVIDQSPILQEMVDDFWRSHFYAGHPLLAAAALQNGITPEALRRDLDDLVSRPTLQVIPALSSRLAEAEARVLATWKKTRSCWAAKAMEVRALFARPGWAKQPYNLADTVAFHFTELDRIWPASGETVERSKSVEFFTTTAIAEGTRARATAPKHEFFVGCEALRAAEGRLVLCLRAQFLSWARAEMKRRKVQRNVFSFDDLLTRLDDSLGAEGGGVLAQSIRERFRAALVDEFQDTDPVQYSIFERIYAGSDATVFFIGDPKQAIYGFRGADVFTYLEAARAATRRYTLPQNWRSETGMVDAVNALFGLRKDAFVLDGIPFQPVIAAGLIDQEPLKIEGAPAPALQLLLATDRSGITNHEADRFLPEAVASEIVRLLNGSATIRSRPVRPPDIAVLVSTNDEAQLVQDALAARQVPAVIYSAANVFRSPEARELATILAAVIEPGHERRLRGALATEALGLTSAGLDALSRDERGWEKHILKFQRYHQVWQDEGFIQMLRILLFAEEVRLRLLTYPDGERRLTNILHLAELLHRMCVDSRLGMSGLLKRLNEAITQSKTYQSEEYEVRLERDEDSVRIATIHKSKGLEYGIVFCPFSWGNPRISRDRNVIFHADGELLLDLERTETNQALQLREKLADKVRLLYVALTRARHRAYLVWGNFKSGQESAPAHLLGPWANRGVAALADEPSVGATELAKASAESYRPEQTATTIQPARTFGRALDRSYGIASFTRLITGQEKTPESPEYDSVEVAEAEAPRLETDAPLTGMFAFPRGTGPGTCLHHIFEELDFEDLEALPDLVRRKLRAFSITGFDETVSAMIERVLSVPLRPGLTLSRIPHAARLVELEFYFPIESVTKERIAGLFDDRRLRFQEMSGFMKGFIDLVFEHKGKFYIADWKSNWLGPDLESYHPSAMAAEMVARFYNLQLSIYVVALHRFLRARLPGYDYDQHFGGVYYLFLRGIDPARPELGIYRARPDGRFIAQLSGVLSHDR